MAKKVTTVSVSTPKIERKKNSAKNVNQKLLNSLTKERNENPSSKTIAARIKAHDLIKLKGGQGNAKKNLLQREEASNLVDTYSNWGVTFAQAMQAVKTNKVSERVQVWANKAQQNKA